MESNTKYKNETIFIRRIEFKKKKRKKKKLQMDKRGNEQTPIIHLCSSSVGAANLFSGLAYALSTFDKIKKKTKKKTEFQARRKVDYFTKINRSDFYR